MVNSDKVECLVDEVVAQRLEQTLHQRQTKPIHTGPGGGVYGLTGERLREREKERERIRKFKTCCFQQSIYLMLQIKRKKTTQCDFG